MKWLDVGERDFSCKGPECLTIQKQNPEALGVLVGFFGKVLLLLFGLVWIVKYCLVGLETATVETGPFGEASDS